MDSLCRFSRIQFSTDCRQDWHIAWIQLLSSDVKKWRNFDGRGVFLIFLSIKQKITNLQGDSMQNRFTKWTVSCLYRWWTIVKFVNRRIIFTQRTLFILNQWEASAKCLNIQKYIFQFFWPQIRVPDEKMKKMIPNNQWFR